MSKTSTSKPKTGHRLTTQPKIVPEGGRKVHIGVPPLKAFDRDMPGQVAMDFSRDDQDALTEQ